MTTPGALSPDEIARRKKIHEDAMEAFYRHRSESLRVNNTVTADGPPPPPPPPPQPALQRRSSRPGILGWVADAFENATGWH
ncbi:hypothetical protein [Sphingomonas asaccharolytica]|uniref:hypothetical protein n=1 Tax=Sphingomonas asaccharolytica TaxID=40681 RepID=UPI0008358B08|nr:hypothetical protein [Sphingomonas asaccharolytica]